MHEGRQQIDEAETKDSSINVDYHIDADLKDTENEGNNDNKHDANKFSQAHLFSARFLKAENTEYSFSS